MPKLPAFQFYPADWLNDIQLRRVSFEVKGFLIDLMCLMHQSPKYGFLTTDLEKDIHVLLGKDRRTLARLMAEVQQKSLISRDVDTGELFNKRMVKDERIRQARREAGKKGGQKRAPDLLKQKDKQNTPPSSSSSSSSSKRSKSITSNHEKFDDFWSVYPKKKEKKKCLAKWKSRKLDEKANMLISDIKLRMDKDRQWQEGFIPNPLTYINGDRWEDEIDYSGPGEQPATAEEKRIAKIQAEYEASKNGGLPN